MDRQDISPAREGLAHTLLVGCWPGEVGLVVCVRGISGAGVLAAALAAAGTAITVATATASATSGVVSPPTADLTAEGDGPRRMRRVPGGPNTTETAFRRKMMRTRNAALLNDMHVLSLATIRGQLDHLNAQDHSI
jgi:hypothetical protein